MDDRNISLCQICEHFWVKENIAIICEAKLFGLGEIPAVIRCGYLFWITGYYNLMLLN